MKRLALQVILFPVLGILILVIAGFNFRFHHRLLVTMVMANQSAARQDLRALRKAQMGYRANRSALARDSILSFADPECLANPNGCPPDYDGKVAMLGAKDGYRRWFVPGPRWTEAAWREEVNSWAEYRREFNLPPLDPDRVPDGYRDFVYIAVPQYPGLTGEIGYCISPRGPDHEYYPKHIFYTLENGYIINWADEDELHLLFSFSPSSGPRSTEPPFELLWGWDACPMAPSQENTCGPGGGGIANRYLPTKPAS